ncbi:MAG: glycosyltransferase family 2 protein [Clostridia bacterium]|nr:glycosyltransferase family 2 protein [Clostridia bacterium]
MYCAGIVLFNPDFVRTKENINAILPQVDKLFLVDNGSKDISELKEFYKNETKIELFESGKNLGIASALNRLVAMAHKAGFEWILTLDQDSVCEPELIAKYDETLKKVSGRKVGMLTCVPYDRNFGVEKIQDFKGEYTNVERCITSACFTNVAAVIDVGGFDDSMFIDYVDFDMCFLMTEAGYEIIKIGYYGILHELGSSTRKSFLGREVIVTNHSPFRRYWYSRNVVYCMRKHPISKLKYNIKLYGRLMVVVLYEKDKKAKLKEGFRGIKDGRKADISKVRYIDQYLEV